MNPAITARTFIGPTFIFALWRIYEGDRFSREAIAAEITDQLLKGLVAD